MAVAKRAWCVIVPHHARSARQARQRLSIALSGLISPQLLADVLAVTAELIGNAVRHAEPLPGGVVRLAWRIWISGSECVIEIRVTDGGAGSVPRPRGAGPDEMDGRGLTIVAALSDQWGVERDELGQTVWAQLR